MAEVGVLVVVGIILVVEIAVTLRVVLRDDPGRRPTRRYYDSRTPEP